MLRRAKTWIRQRQEQLLASMEEQEDQVVVVAEEEQVETPAEEEQVEVGADEEQVDPDAEEEAAADAELLASGAVDPMMGGVDITTGKIRFRKTISVRPRLNPEARSVIRPTGVRHWREVSWSGQGHRTPVNSALGAFCRFYYPGMVTLPNGERVAAHTWAHWGLKENVEGDGQEVGNRTCQGAVWKGFWGRYRLEGEGDYEKEKMAKQVFQRAAMKVIKDSFTNARIQAIVNYHKRVKNVNMKRTPDVKKMHLTVEEFVQGEVDWIMKDPEAWRWICERWASAGFQKTSNRNRGNRVRHQGKQRFGADGFVGLEQRMEAQTGIRPSFVDVFVRGHQGSDPENPEVLCDEQAAERLAKYKDQLIRRHGEDFDWRAAPPDIEAIYHAGDGLRHGRWGLGDGVLEYDHVPRPQGTGQGSSRRPSRLGQEEARQAQEEARQAREEARQAREETLRLREDNDYMKYYLLELSQRLGSNVPVFRPPHLPPQVPPNYFSTPGGTQRPPVGDAQGSQPPPNWMICSGQAPPVGDGTHQGSQPPLQWIYPNQGPPFGDASQSQHPPQWMYPGQALLGDSTQGSQPPSQWMNSKSSNLGSVNLGTAYASPVPAEGTTPQFGAVRGSEDNTVRRLRNGKVLGVPSAGRKKRGRKQKKFQHESVPDEGATSTADLTSHENVRTARRTRSSWRLEQGH